MRHAKSSWEPPELDDIERPLNPRGERSAPKMGRRLRREGRAPARIYASPARRSRETARAVAAALGLPAGDIEIESRLYPGDVAGLLGVIRSLPDDDARLMLVGHNPALTELVNALVADAEFDNVPTAGYAHIVFDCARWAEVAPGAGRLARFDYPKSKQRARRNR